MSMKLIFSGLIILVISILVASIFFDTSSLKIRCDIEGAEVSIDGMFKGESPSLDVKVRGGKHKIVIRKNLADGSYYYYEKNVMLGDEVSPEIYARLERVYTEEYYWKKAENSGDIREYEEYLKECPNGKNVKKAVYTLEALYFSFCKNIPGCNKYLEKYPNGRYANKARDTIEDIYFSFCKNISGCNKYLEKYPNGRYAKIANNNVEDLKKPITPTVLLTVFKEVWSCKWSTDKDLSELKLTDVNISYSACNSGETTTIWFGDIKDVVKRQPGWPGYDNERAVMIVLTRSEINLHFRTEAKRDDFYQKLNTARNDWFAKYPNVNK